MRRRKVKRAACYFVTALAMHRVYIETSVISYLTARPSTDLVVAGHQQLTRNWWDRRARFELFISEAVLQEAMRGDTAAAKERAEALEGIPVLTVHSAAESLATSFIADAALPPKAAIDAVHIALASVHGMDFLLTWNAPT